MDYILGYYIQADFHSMLDLYASINPTIAFHGRRYHQGGTSCHPDSAVAAFVLVFNHSLLTLCSPLLSE
jgi:hypothetical protein